MVVFPQRLTFRITKVEEDWYQAQCVEVPAIITGHHRYRLLFKMIEDAVAQYVLSQFTIVIEGHIKEDTP